MTRRTQAGVAVPTHDQGGRPLEAEELRHQMNVAHTLAMQAWNDKDKSERARYTFESQDPA